METRACAGTESGPCRNGGRVKARGYFKRCAKCAEEQHRIVAKRSWRKHWPRYREQRKQAKHREPPTKKLMMRPALLELAVAAGLRAA